MLTKEAAAAELDHPAAEALFDKRRLQALGILLPIRLSGLSFFSGRHPLGRAGEGMRFLRTRPFESGQDNPRDIDKFSPPGELRINEWEAEAQATIEIYADVSASMQFAPTKRLLNLALLQLTYSLWRAGDRVKTSLIDAISSRMIEKRNLKSQLDHLVLGLDSDVLAPGRSMVGVLMEQLQSKRGQRAELQFAVSDFQGEDGVTDDIGESAWRLLQRQNKCDVVPVIISFRLDAGRCGSIRLWDAERNRFRMTLVTPLRVERINAAEVARVNHLEQSFRKLGMNCVVIRRAQDVYPEFVRLARWRRRHGH